MQDIFNSQEFAAAFARIFLGFLFFFQGFDAVFHIRMKNVVSTYRYDFDSMGIPPILTITAAWFTSLSELVCGALLVIGLFKYTALYLLGINMIVAAIGLGMGNPLWDLRHVLPRLALLLFLLVIPAEWDVLLLDKVLFP